MKRWPLALAGVTGVIACGTSGGGSDSGIDAAGDAGGFLFDDEFGGAALDTTAWLALDRPGDSSNSELECYRSANVSEANGSLVLTSQVDGACSPLMYGSGMAQWKSFDFLYGTIEIRAREAGGKGQWPALWLLGADCQQTNPTTAANVGTCNWPASGSDEIDIAEIKSSDHTTVWQNVISGGTTLSCSPQASDVSQNWHVYRLVWAPGQLIWQIDGVTTCTQATAVPSQPMFLIINTAMGGAGGAIDPGNLPQRHLVDYVHVWK